MCVCVHWYVFVYAYVCFVYLYLYNIYTVCNTSVLLKLKKTMPTCMRRGELNNYDLFTMKYIKYYKYTGTQVSGEDGLVTIAVDECGLRMVR